MTYNEKKSLYESIMKEVAKDVKKRLNEEDSSHNQQSYESQQTQQTQQNSDLTNFQKQWVEQWNAFAQDYKNFKSNVYDGFKNIEKLLSRIDTDNKEEREYIQKNIMNKLEKLEEVLYEIRNK